MIIADGRLPRALGVASLWGGDVKIVRYESNSWSPRQKAREISIPVPKNKLKTLTGFPSYATFRFPMPEHTPVIKGYFVLEYSLQIPHTGGGAIRVMINNEKRADILLDHQQEKYRIYIPLNQFELEGRSLVISLSADGYGAGGECPDDRSRIAVIDIDQRTRLELVLDEPITHPADAVLLAGEPVRFLVEPGANQRKRETMLTLAQELMREGRGVAFVSERERGRDTVLRIDPKARKARYDRKTQSIIVAGRRDLNLLVRGSVSGRTNFPKKEKYDVSVFDFGAAPNVRQFRHEIKWRINFALKDMPKGKAPSVVDYKIFRSLSGQESTSLVSVSLNDQLLHSEIVSGEQNTISDRQLLPIEHIELENTIEFTLVNNEERFGVCNPGRDAFAQLEDISSFGKFRKFSELKAQSLPHQLFNLEKLQINAPHELTATDYADASKLLMKVSPSAVMLSTTDEPGNDGAARATIIPAKELRENIGAYLDSSMANTERLGGQAVWIAARDLIAYGNDLKADYAVLSQVGGASFDRFKD